MVAVSSDARQRCQIELHGHENVTRMMRGKLVVLVAVDGWKLKKIYDEQNLASVMAGNWYNHGEMRRWFCSSSRLRSSTFWLFSGSEDDARMTNSSRASDWYPYLMVRCLESQIAVGPVLPIRFGLSWLSLASLYVSLSFFLFLLLSFSIYSNKYLFFFLQA